MGYMPAIRVLRSGVNLEDDKVIYKRGLKKLFRRLFRQKEAGGKWALIGE